MALPDQQKWSAFVAIATAVFLVIVGTLVLLSALLTSETGLRVERVALFGAMVLDVGACWLCDASFAARLYTRDPDLWYELGRPEINQPWGPARYRRLYFRLVPPARYPPGLWAHHQLCRLLQLVWIGLSVALVVACLNR